MKGWTLPVVFDPREPDNAAIAENPYLHGAGGRAAPSSPLRTWCIRALVAATLLLAASGGAALVFAASALEAGSAGYDRAVLAGAVLLLAAVGAAGIGGGADRLAAALRRRRTAVTTTGVVTQTWTETRRGSESSGPKRVFPYAVRFELPDGRQVHRRAHDTPSAPLHEPGREVDVTYHRDDPTVFAVGGAWRTATGPVLAIVFGALFAGAAAATLMAASVSG
nr:DUF3592 domain-containing protein [Streptomonospora sp. PA3]